MKAVVERHMTVVPTEVDSAAVSRETAWRIGRIAFEGETLSRAAGEFARYSEIRIVIDDPLIGAKTITGLFVSNDPIGFRQGRSVVTRSARRCRRECGSVVALNKGSGGKTARRASRSLKAGEHRHPTRDREEDMRLGDRKALLMCGAAGSVLFAAMGAAAQERSFDIPSELAVKAIPELARQAGVQIVAPADELKGVVTPAVKGTFDVHTALLQLVAHTDMRVISDDGQTIVLKAPAKKTRAALNEGRRCNRSRTRPSLKPLPRRRLPRRNKAARMSCRPSSSPAPRRSVLC